MMKLSYTFLPNNLACLVVLSRIEVMSNGGRAESLNSSPHDRLLTSVVMKFTCVFRLADTSGVKFVHTAPTNTM